MLANKERIINEERLTTLFSISVFWFRSEKTDQKENRSERTEVLIILLQL